MTLIVGILCSDGVVMASDSAASLGAGGQLTIGQQNTQKLYNLKDQVLFSSTGAIGISQIISNVLVALLDGKELSGVKHPTPDALMDRLGRAVAETVGPYLKTAALQHQICGEASSSLCKSLVAIPAQKKPCLFQFDYNGSPERATPELPFISLGSGQRIADPFLALLRRLLWKDSAPSVAEGRLAAVWTIEHAKQTNPGGIGGPIQLATLASSGGDPVVRVATAAEAQEDLGAMLAAEQALVREIKATPKVPPPPPPKPKSG